MNENEILGFDPSQLSVFNTNETPKSQGNPLIYKTRPIDSVDEDKIYRCTIKLVYNPFDFNQSILEQQSYYMEDAEGGFTAISSLTVNDTSCPIFKAWKKCHFIDPKKAKTPEEAEFAMKLWKQAALKKDGGNELFDKRFARYCVVQVLADRNQPELVNKYLFWKLPKAIWDIVNAKIKPSKPSDASAPSKAPIPVMDFLFGRSIDIEVTPGPGAPTDDRYRRETKYMGEISDEIVTCKNPDGSNILNDEEQAILDTYVEAMNKVWKSKDAAERARLTDEINAAENTTALRAIYTRVLASIKEVCPNLIEELSYHPWDEQLTARVQNWINIVLKGETPAVPKAPEAVTTQETPQAPVQETVTAAPTSDETSDLPF